MIDKHRNSAKFPNWFSRSCVYVLKPRKSQADPTKANCMTDKRKLTRRKFVESSILPAMAAGALASTPATIRADASIAAITNQSTTIFSFDDVSIPYKQNLKLTIHQPKKHPQNPAARG